MADKILRIRIKEKLKLNWRNIIGVAASMAIIDPMFGIKFKKKVMVARSNATSTFKDSKDYKCD